MTLPIIGILGSGTVGEVLANGFLTHGHTVMRGSREPGKLADWLKGAGAHAKTGSFQETASAADILVLAVKGTAAEGLIKGLPEAALHGKIVIDATNPIAAKPPVNGVLRFFTGPDESLMERLQAAAPSARFVKAFSCTGNANMVNPVFEGGKPSMFICGDSAEAKATVREILNRFGWDTEDMGAVEAARAIEPLCMLWCIPGLVHQQWTHAFKLLKR